MSATYRSPKQSVVFGSGALDHVVTEFERLGYERLALVTSRRAGSSDAARAVRTAFAGKIFVDFNGVKSAAPVDDVYELLEALGGQSPDAFLTVGGGSSCDAVKAVRVALAGGNLREPESLGLMGSGQTMAITSGPMISIPTTLSGAEFTSGASYLLNGSKRGIYYPELAADTVVLDADLVRDVPTTVLLTTGMNALAHCIESTYGQMANPVSVALARQGALDLVGGQLALAIEERSHDAVQRLLTGAAFGGMSLATGGASLHHAVCHALGTMYGMPHAISNSIILPHALRFNELETAAAQADFAADLSPVLAKYGVRTSGTLANIIYSLQQTLGVPSSLTAAGIPVADVAAIAETTFHEFTVKSNPRAVESPDDLIPLLLGAFHGNGPMQHTHGTTRDRRSAQ